MLSFFILFLKTQWYSWKNTTISKIDYLDKYNSYLEQTNNLFSRPKFGKLYNL